MDIVTTTKRDASIEEMVEVCLLEFETFHLSEVGKDILRGYFGYQLQKPNIKIPYRFLLQTESDSRGYDFFQKLKKITGEITERNLKDLQLTENDFLKGKDIKNIANSDMIYVSECISNEDYYPNDYDTTPEREKKLQYERTWTIVKSYFRKNPNKTLVLCAPKEIIQGRIRNNADLYFRFFRNRIVIGNMTCEEVYEKLLDIIDDKIGKITADFKNELKEYINTVYPKADLQNMEFVDDLFEWMVTLTLQKNDNCDCFSASSIPFYHKLASFESIDKEFQSLVGLDSVKKTFHDIGVLSQRYLDTNKKPYLHMVFRGNPGTGKTTVAGFVAKLLSSMRVIKRNHVEQVMTSDLIGQFTGQTAPKVDRILEKASGGVLFIDEAYLLNPDAGAYTDTYRQECIATLMKAMERKVDPVIIFAGYPKEMDELMKSNPGLNSRIGYHLEFEDFDTDQLVEIFKSMCEKAGYSYNEQTLSAVERKIIALKYEENFGNARTVENIFDQAVIETMRTGAGNNFISENSIQIEADLKLYDELQHELDAMVGIEEAKRTLKEQLKTNRFCKEQGKQLPSSNNMIFVGNAGTGKTTTAKLFSEMLFSIGVTKSPRIKLITARDLFVSNVTTTLNEICREAMGGVLFIDEIYLLQGHQYICTEVVSVLLEFLEERKEDLTVILAGYEKQMDDFLNENQGLHSRFPITVHFDDFTEDELVQIFIANCKDNKMILSPEGQNQFREIIRKEMNSDNFGNGRTVRNHFESAFRRHAVNYYENDNLDPDYLLAEDIKEMTEVNDNKYRLGFIH